MADFVSASVYSLFHLLGHGVPTVLTNIFVNTPVSAYKSITGAPPREGAWLLAASGKRTKEGAEGTGGHQAFDSMDFFGFKSHEDPRYSAHGFTTERYPYPLYSGHYHTIVGGGRRPSRKMGYEREEIKAKFDGNTLYLEWRLCDAKKFPDGPKGVIAVVPGLCSGPNTSYVQRFVRHANHHGFHVVVLAIRGMGSSPLEYGNMTAGTFTHDISFVLEEHLTADYLNKRFGQKDLKLMAVGFSLGGAMLANHLGTTPKSHLHCAIAAESPWDFHKSTAMMGTRFAKIAYQPALMKGLWNVVKKTGDNILEHTKSDTLRENLQMLQGKMKKRDGMKGYTVNDFDKLIVAPAQGFESADAYYTAASPFQRLGNVTVPLMCFSAMDDPITGPPPALPEWNAVCDTNPNILHLRCPTGGHLGFMRGPLDELKGLPGFMDELVVKAFESAVAKSSSDSASSAVSRRRSNSGNRRHSAKI